MRLPYTTVDIVEQVKHAGPNPVLVPTQVRINGVPVLTSAEDGIVTTVGQDEAVMVSLTILASEVRHRSEPFVDDDGDCPIYDLLKKESQ